MTKLEEEVKQAFDAVDVPSDLNVKTLSFIETQRQSDAPVVAAEADEPAVAEGVNDFAVNAWEQRVISDKRKIPMSMRMAFIPPALRAVACFALALVLAGFGGYSWVQAPTAYADVAASSEVQLKVNRFGTVVGHDVTNADAEARAKIDALGLEGKSYEAALNILLESEPTTDVVQVNVCGQNKQQQQELTDKSAACLKNQNRQGNCTNYSADEWAQQRHQYRANGQAGNGAGNGNGAGQAGNGNANGNGSGNGQAGNGIGNGNGYRGGNGNG